MEALLLAELHNTLEGIMVIAPPDKSIDNDFSIPPAINDNHVKLLVVLCGQEDEQNITSFRGSRLDWTLDHGFEYLEVDLNNPTKGTELCRMCLPCVH